MDLNQEENSKRLKYSIVVNTYNRSADLVSRCLLASLNQKDPPEKIFLIDQNSEELGLPDDISSNSILARSKTDLKAVSAARNTVKISENMDWIFFCDDDGYPCDDYSEKVQKILTENPSLEILAGSIVREDNNEYYTLRHKKGGSLKKFRNTKNLMGSNFVVKASVFDELGRFDENFGAGSFWGSSEETDFCWKAYFAGKDMEYFPELIVYHVPPFNESIKEGFSKSFRYGVGKGALVSKWLFKKKKIRVTYELIEMLTVPFVQSLRGLITFKFGLITSNFAALTGRIYGLIKYLLVSHQ